MKITYVIIAAGDLSSVTGWGGVTVLPQSPDTLRWNVGHTKTFVKFPSSNPTPSFLVGKTQYTHAEMMTEMATTEWALPTPPE